MGFWVLGGNMGIQPLVFTAPFGYKNSSNSCGGNVCFDEPNGGKVCHKVEIFKNRSWPKLVEAEL
jgi:hypothetical protein